jgi:hypothetical protein
MYTSATDINKKILPAMMGEAMRLNNPIRTVALAFGGMYGKNEKNPPKLLW